MALRCPISWFRSSFIYSINHYGLLLFSDLFGIVNLNLHYMNTLISYLMLIYSFIYRIISGFRSWLVFLSIKSSLYFTINFYSFSHRSLNSKYYFGFSGVMKYGISNIKLGLKVVLEFWFYNFQTYVTFFIYLLVFTGVCLENWMFCFCTLVFAPRHSQKTNYNQRATKEFCIL